MPKRATGALPGLAQHMQMLGIDPGFEMFYTYVLEILAKPGEFYRGHTGNLKQWVAEHNDGKCPRTSKFRPWKVKVYTAFASLELARECNPGGGCRRGLN